MIDEIGEGAKLVWAQDGAGEIGKRPKLEPNCFEIDGGSYCELAQMRQKGVKK
jgi:hypothetical protein